MSQDTAHAWWSRLRHQGLLLSPVVMLERYPSAPESAQWAATNKLRDAQTRFAAKIAPGGKSGVSPGVKSGVSPSFLPKKMNRHRITRKKMNRHRITRADARESVLVAGYAVYRGQRVFQALADRMLSIPALKVRMFLDIQRGPGDTTSATQLILRFADRFRSHQWPEDRPLPEVFFDPRSLETDPGQRACLHAKCVIVDERNVFISSANFTEAAQKKNLEIGLLIRSHSLAGQVTGYFEELVAKNLLAQVCV